MTPPAAVCNEILMIDVENFWDKKLKERIVW